jgi:2',3'-cyclic-nucleotide 2'-phosphodiesterase (5'-nucleotidase family)
MALIRPAAAARRLALALLVALLATPHAPLAQTEHAGAVRVTLLQVNDVYRFTPADRGAHGGLARVSPLRKRIMKESPNALFLLSGDTISPSVESITYAVSTNWRRPRPASPRRRPRLNASEIYV